MAVRGIEMYQDPCPRGPFGNTPSRHCPHCVLVHEGIIYSDQSACHYCRGYTFHSLRQLQRDCPLGLPSSGDYRPYTFSKLIHNSKGIENICHIAVLFIGGQVIMNVQPCDIHKFPRQSTYFIVYEVTKARLWDISYTLT